MSGGGIPGTDRSEGVGAAVRRRSGGGPAVVGPAAIATPGPPGARATCKRAGSKKRIAAGIGTVWVDRWHAASTSTRRHGGASRKGRVDMSDTKTSTKRSSSAKTSANVWSEGERAAMQESARERKKAARLSPAEERAEGEADVQAKIAEMPEDDRAIAARIRELVLETAPDLVPRTYYGMPAFAKDGKVICFFQPKAKFKVRYSTLGFQPDASLDDEAMWPVAFAITRLTAANEKRIAALIKKAAS
jgi:uncharacterized protein YdhG (YjbR/CyaY superfamily)